MSPRSRRLLLLAALLFTVFCVFRAPVSLFALFLPKPIQLSHAEGSLWNGRASALGLGDLVVQEQLEWQLRPQALWSGHLEWAIRSRFADKPGALTLDLSLSGAEIRDLDLHLPLEPLTALHPRLKTIRIGALVHASARRVARDVPISARIDVDGLFSPMVPLAGQLGDYRVDLELDAQGKGNWHVYTIAGVLAVQGDGPVDAQAGQINGKLIITPSTTLPGLSPALSQLPRSGDGYLIAF